MSKKSDRLSRVSCLTLLAGLCVFAPAAASENKWQTLGLMRVRDMTPFGIARLDMLPAHAVAATPGTFAFEVNLSYQNTWALSENVEDYLAARGVERGEIAEHTNLILQASASRSAVQETALDELSADKIQATLGIQWLYRGNVIRFGITENVASFNNTPDVGVNLSVARILFGSRRNGS